MGSPYAIGDYQVDPALGGDEGLASLRLRLRELVLLLMLDFVPNHMALDHAWLESQPQRFVRGDIQKLEAEMRGESDVVVPPVEAVAADAPEPLAQVQTAIEPQVQTPAQSVAAATNLAGSSIADQLSRLENWLVNINRVRGVA